MRSATSVNEIRHWTHQSDNQYLGTSMTLPQVPTFRRSWREERRRRRVRSYLVGFVPVRLQDPSSVVTSYGFAFLSQHSPCIPLASQVTLVSRRRDSCPSIT